MSMKLDKCPKCGLSLPAPDVSCARCGLVFDKWRPVSTHAEVIVTNGDLRDDYRVLAPLFTYTTDRDGIVRTTAEKYGITMEVAASSDLDLLHTFATGERFVSHSLLPLAFAVCVESLKRACLKAGGDAVVEMRVDVDIDSGKLSE
jgi:hypothetical protein